MMHQAGVIVRTQAAIAAFILWMAPPTPSAAAQIISQDAVSQFAQHSEESQYRIDHASWSRFLSQAVFDVGPSTRRPAPRGKGGVYTGTRMTHGSRSRYRYEGNRVLFHLFNEDTDRFLSSYRTGLQNAVNRVEYSALTSDEQLAFWLNLHNVVVIDEIAKRYPISSPQRIRMREYNNGSLFEAKLVAVNGVSLSLNDIRYGIVYRYWDSPDVVYGFWDGSIGGPNIPTGAFTSDNVWEALSALGDRYVNSLRGVEMRAGKLGVSEVYYNAQTLFPSWPQDLLGHLHTHARADVLELLSRESGDVKIIPYDRATADFASGETATFGGSDNAAALLSLRPEVGEDTPVDLLQDFGAPFRNKSSRGGVSADTEIMVRRAEEQAKRREGEVSIEDVETTDPGESETAQKEDAPSPDAGEPEDEDDGS